MALGNTITGLANLIGFNLYYVFKFFENILNGYTIFLIVLSMFMLIMVLTKYMTGTIKNA